MVEKPTRPTASKKMVAAAMASKLASTLTPRSKSEEVATRPVAKAPDAPMISEREVQQAQAPMPTATLGAAPKASDVTPEMAGPMGFLMEPFGPRYGGPPLEIGDPPTSDSGKT